MTIRAVAEDDVSPLSHVLARAFEHDPLHRWIFPGDRAWARSSHRSFAMALRQARTLGVALTDDARNGAAIWHDSTRTPGLWERIVFALRMLPLLGTRALLIGRGFDQLAVFHPREPHWYLYALGTDPRHQGKGIGSQLFGPMLTRCDAERRTAYLEASRPQNVPYYERFGFKVVGEHTMPHGPVVWRMLRMPA
jgi:GNAT superfamily N-acetyltransferase